MTDPATVSRRRFLRDTPAAGTLLAGGAAAAAVGEAAEVDGGYYNHAFNHLLMAPT